ncbi:MAG TPA: type I restriction-modification system subunit M N-terminal domain-containing protein [Nitrososphaeraceae archaeon]|nr:type I restriction-modification system subunit M N-terminal domain-containing protein [Nitrososphaeraceae archaeon]
MMAEVVGSNNPTRSIPFVLVNYGIEKRRKEQAADIAAKATANYSFFNQKITFDFLKYHLWAAADILRGSLDPADYRQPIMTLLLLGG